MTAVTLYTDVECAEALGCSKSTLWRWVKDGKFPRPVKIGNMSRWPASDAEIFIQDALDKRAA